MTGLVIAANDSRYQQLFAGVARSWFRLETLQYYGGSDDDVRAVAAGQSLPRQDGPWYNMLRSHTEAGRALRRVHVIEEPPSPYITYELAVYQDTAAAGEDIRVLPTQAGTWPQGIPRHDFWILDGDQVWIMRYDAEGTFEAVEQVSNPDVVIQHQQWATASWQTSMSLSAYLPSTGLRPAI
jgi:hypothetical protein